MSQDSETQITASVVVADPVDGPDIDVERIRFSGEKAAANAVRADPWMQELVVAADARGRADSSRARRQLAARGGRMTEGMAPELWEAARRAASQLAVLAPIEIHQADPTPNAALALVDMPVLVEVRPRLVALLDGPSTTALVGQQLGHHLAHGPGTRDGALGLVVTAVLEEPTAPPETRRAASTLAMAREITADRFGLIACGDLSAALRLEMAVTTGLAAATLTWDTSAYLEQCRALVEQARQAAFEGPTTYPEHGLRAWALGLFSETWEYREITGEGPGTRSVEEIDAMIADVLGATAPDGLAESAVVLDPLPEVHECALASAALLALSDGELTDEESLAIEHVFAPLVGDWERYLLWDHAIEAFADTSAVVIQGGPAVQRSVFQVLVHVLAADAEVDAREIETVCAIGDALQAGELFRLLLAPVLKAFGADVPDLSKIREVIPMPARASEAETALRVFLEGLARRGGGEVTLRRMYRLLGDRDGRATSQATVKRLLAEVGLTTPVILSETMPDQPVRIVLTDEALRAFYEAERPRTTRPGRLPCPVRGIRHRA